MECVQKQLFAMRDEGYRDFSSALMPNIDKETVIGVRTPALRKLAKEFAKEAQAAEFMRRRGGATHLREPVYDERVIKNMNSSHGVILSFSFRSQV